MYRLQLKRLVAKNESHCRQRNVLCCDFYRFLPCYYNTLLRTRVSVKFVLLADAKNIVGTWFSTHVCMS